MDKSGQAFARLREANKTIGLVDGQMANAVDSSKTDVAKIGKSLKDSILNIQKMFMPERDAKGIVRNANSLMNAIYKAQGMLSSSQGKPKANAMIAFDDAQKRAAKVFEKVNKFFETDWAKYQQKVEAVKYSLFKKYEPLKQDWREIG